MGSSSLTRNWTPVPCIGSSLPWTTMEIPILVLLLGWPGVIQAEPRLTFGAGPPIRQRAKRKVSWLRVGAQVGPGVRCVRAISLQSCPTLCNPMDCSPPGFSVHGILQARILEWVAMSSSRGSSRLRDWTHVSYISWIGRWVLYYHPGCPWCKVVTVKCWRFHW